MERLRGLCARSGGRSDRIVAHFTPRQFLAVLPESLGMPSRVNESKRHLVILARVAAVVAVGDWLTKAVAARLVAVEPLIITGNFRFAVVHNDASAFGLSAGAYTWQLNFALTLAVMVLMIPVARELSQIDRAAPRALGLIMGGALGNLASLALAPPGVVDFISVGLGRESALVFNLADVAAYIGLAMMTRTAFLIVAEMRRRAQPVRTVLVRRRATVERRAFSDREVPLEASLADVVMTDAPGVIPRPESVRRIEMIDNAISDPQVIDIRAHLAPPRSEVRSRRSEHRAD